MTWTRGTGLPQDGDESRNQNQNQNGNQKIQVLATEDEITLWWEKPNPIPKEYHILLNGKLVHTVTKTHTAIENLLPDTVYRIEVTELCESRSVSTGRTKRCLDVTAAPYFAAGDGKTMNTEVLQKAIDDCGKEDKVYLPAGIYLTGALRLHSDMELYLEKGAVLQGTDSPEDYLPRIASRFEGTEMECYSSLLNLGYLDHEKGADCENVVIRGKGTIASGGQKLARRIIEDERIRLKGYIASLGDKVKECENDDTIPGRVRPRLMNLSNCKNVRISGLTFMNGASWNVHMIYSSRITVDHCVFKSEKVWNGDGWDPDSSSDCTLFASVFYTGDDAAAIKSGKNPEGNLINRPSERIRIFDCYSAFGHGICIGSEMSGGINDVKIWDCDLENSMYGLEIKGTKKRGGYVRNIVVQDCILPRIQIHSVRYNDDGAAADEPPVFEKCRFERMRLTGSYLKEDGSRAECAAIYLEGFEEPGCQVRDILFKDIILETKTPQNIIMQHCKNVNFENINSVSV